ncbi:MAG: PIN domain nuclease [Deltaproteobacteria bacterium]|nr:MAG: PIN domain nuclease [Deltaproteobacteria bacterium]
MSALIIDTSSWIAYFGDGRRADVIEDGLREGRVYLPPVVAAELTSGTLTKRKLTELMSFLEDLALCHTPLEHWLRVGSLRAKLRRAGETISTPDAHVAQCALDLGGELLSEDGVFRRIAGSAGLRLLAA